MDCEQHFLRKRLIQAGVHKRDITEDRSGHWPLLVHGIGIDRHIDGRWVTQRVTPGLRPTVRFRGLERALAYITGGVKT